MRTDFQAALHRLRSEIQAVETARASAEYASKPTHARKIVEPISYDAFASYVEDGLRTLGRSDRCTKNNVASWLGRGVLPGHAYLLAILVTFFGRGRVGDLSEEAFIAAYNATASKRSRPIFRTTHYDRTSDRQRWRNLVYSTMGRIHPIPLLMAAADPSSLVFDDLRFRLTDNRLFVAQPTWFQELAVNKGFQPNSKTVDFGDAANWQHVYERYEHLGINEQTVNDAVESVALFFANDLNDPTRPYKVYNRPKFGVHNLEFVVPTQGEERQAVNFDLFETDYFTHTVLQRIIKQLISSGRLGAYDGYPVFAGQVLSHFMTSFGINISLISTYAGTRRLILGRWSHNNLNVPNRGKFHCIANEAVNLSDAPTFQSGRRFSFSSAVKRCLDEELGLPHDRIISATIDGLFVVCENFELGVHVILETDASPDDIARYRLTARDARREMLSELAPVELTYADLASFVAQYEEGVEVLFHYLPPLLDTLLERENERHARGRVG